MSESVTFTMTDGVGVIRLNRPDKLNAMDDRVFDGLQAAAADAAAAIAGRDCRAVLVIGAGRSFSSGLDTSLFEQQVAGGGIDEERIAHLQRAFTAVEDLAAPTVAAVRGHALGAGCQLALACHMRVAASDAVFGLLEVRYGLLPDLGATLRLPRLVGLGRATELAVTGDTVDANTAHQWGLVNAIIDDHDFEAAAQRFALQLAEGPPLATGTLPGLLREGWHRSRDEQLQAERRAQLVCLGSADFGEAVAAAVEGRPPAFRGR